MRKAILIMLLTAWSSSAVAGWIKIGGNDDTAAYTDPTAYIKESDRIKIGVMYDSKSARTAGEYTFSSSKQQFECDCKKAQHRRLSVYFYSENMGEGEMVFSYVNPGEWESGSRSLIGGVCNVSCVELVKSGSPHLPSSRTSEVVGGMDLPHTLAGFELNSVKDLEKLSPGLGVSLSYKFSGIVATVYVYDATLGNIPDGVDSPIIKKHFAMVKSDAIKVRPDAQIQILDRESQFLVEGIPVLHSAFQYTSMVEGVRKKDESHLYLTAIKGNFVKVRITYSGSDHPELGLRLQTQFIKSLCREMAKAVKNQMPISRM